MDGEEADGGMARRKREGGQGGRGREGEGEDVVMEGRKMGGRRGGKGDYGEEEDARIYITRFT
jgi:hypothetical protein